MGKKMKGDERGTKSEMGGGEEGEREAGEGGG